MNSIMGIYTRLLPGMESTICCIMVIHYLVDSIHNYGAQPSGLRATGPSDARLMLTQ